MQTIIFAGTHGHPFAARFGLVFGRTDGGYQNVTIVVVQPKGDHQMSLLNSDSGRDSILNRILKNELEGVRLEFIRFVLILESSDRLDGWEFKIKLDVDDYVAKGNPAEVKVDKARGLQEVSYHSVHAVGGCARCVTKLNASEQMDEETAKVWLMSAGFLRELPAMAGQ